MNQKERIEKIESILKQEPIGTKELQWKDGLETMSVYKIPLDFLVYNKYNGRILSRTKSYERNGKEINPESIEGKQLIEKLLYDSREDRNKKTLENLKTFGQKEYGIITKDGIIIDGNRRAMLLNKIKKYDFFKAVILPVTLQEDSSEIQKLEVSYQMGEDEKLSYNPIEKYLKAKDMYDIYNFEIDKIAQLMGESDAKIEEFIEISKLFEEYLDFYNCGGYYFQLDGREDSFISLNKWLNNFKEEGSIKGFDGYKSTDVDNLKSISFDYIRAKYEGKEFRNIASGLKENHLFGDKEIWESFFKKHTEFIEPIFEKEKEINFQDDNIMEILQSRDNDFKKEAGEFLEENLNNHLSKIRNNQIKNKPDKLINQAMDSIRNIDINNQSIKNNISDDILKEFNDVVTDKFFNNNIKESLCHILRILNNINLDEEFKRDEVLDSLKRVQTKAYQIEKEVKSKR